MRTLFGVGLVFLCLGLAGCSLFGKKNSTADGSSRSGSSGGGVARTEPTVETGGPTPGANGLLAGQVQDADNRRRPGVLIQVVDLQEAKNSAARIEVEADRNGYFTIQGLQAGHHYQLVARVKDGERLLSGTVLVTPPNPRLSIMMSEDFTSSTTPPLPKPTPLPDKTKGTTKQGGPAATIQPPRMEDEPAPPPKSPASSVGVKDPSKIAEGDGYPKPPVISISPTPPRYVPPPPKPLDTQPPPEEDPLLPKGGSGADKRSPDSGRSVVAVALTPVPSCVLVGNKLDNFALTDLDGQTWEYKRDHRGRLTLLNFWHSTCPPCLQTVPVLVQWEKTYGSSGLEVIGIAYEKGEREEQVQNVRATRGRYSINYTTLLGGPERCPVEQQFKVEAHPTLVLLDESGQIIWRGTGYDPAKLQELEFEIRKRLERRR